MLKESIYIKFKSKQNYAMVSEVKRVVRNMDSVGKPGSPLRAGNLFFDLSSSYTGPCILKFI